MSATAELLIDLVVIAVFIAGVAQFRTPAGARRGNATAAVAFAAALGLLVYRNSIGTPWLTVPAIALGGALGWWVSARITMTRIPALIALQNGAGGGASLLVSLVELGRLSGTGDALGVGFGVAGALVGGVALSGSLVAAAKLEGRIGGRPKALPGHALWQLVLLAAVAAVGVALASGSDVLAPVVATGIVAAATLALGVLLALRVGGADMPVMISLLNAFSGLAAAFVGVAVGNEMLIAAGAMVGSSGTILTLVMARAMNRSVLAILTGGQAVASAPAPVTGGPSAESTGAGGSLASSAADGVPSAEPSVAPEPEPVPEPMPAPEPAGDPVERAKAALASARSVIVVPGYGMAVAQAQQEVATLASGLETAGKTVRFAVHPVAGRMPGHMHVLLAEADVEYDKLFEMDAINDDFAATDVALIVGACDVVNPAAITAPDTPISGMPILRAHEAAAVIVCNLDARPGYSGVENPLYDEPKTIMLLGDAKETVRSLIG